MNKYLLSIGLSAFAASVALADITVTTDTTSTDGNGVVKFDADNVTLTLTGAWTGTWGSPRITTNVATKATLDITSTGSLQLTNNANFFGDNTVSPGTGDIYITGEGSITTTLTAINIVNSNSNLYIGAATDFSGATMAFGASTRTTVQNSFLASATTIASGASVNIDAATAAYSTAATTLNGTLNVKNGSYSGSTISVNSAGVMNISGGTYTGSGTSTITGALNLSSGTFNSGGLIVTGSVNISGGNYNATTGNVALNSGANFVQTGGVVNITNAATTVSTGATLDLGVSYGYRTRWLTMNGGTLIIRAENALVQSMSGETPTYRVISVNSGNLKLYANQQFNSLYFSATSSVLDIYSNGYDLTFANITGVDGAIGKINLIVEDGYSWENDAIHFLSANSDTVRFIINSITIDGVAVDLSNLNIVSDGGAGYYVNIIPEPAEWAAIFGALALSLAVWRRKRK